MLSITDTMVLDLYMCVYVYIYSLEEGVATHSSILAWRIPWTEEPGRLQSETAEAT